MTCNSLGPHLIELCYIFQLCLTRIFNSKKKKYKTGYGSHDEVIFCESAQTQILLGK